MLRIRYPRIDTIPVPLERMRTIAAAAIVLFFWGATLTWAAMLLVAAILFQDSLRSLFASLNTFLSRTAELEVLLGKTDLSNLAPPWHPKFYKRWRMRLRRHYRG